MFVFKKLRRMSKIMTTDNLFFEHIIQEICTSANYIMCQTYFFLNNRKDILEIYSDISDSVNYYLIHTKL